MKPGHVPDEHVWPGAKRVRFDPPEGHDSRALEILPVEGLVDEVRFREGGQTMATDRIHFRIEFEPRDLDLLRERGWCWLVFYGGVYPFAIEHPEEAP